jgi:hypothetical protein
MKPSHLNLPFLRRPAAAVALSLACGVAAAAPLDALLSAARVDDAGKGELELSYDMVNNSVDFLHLRSSGSGGTTSTTAAKPKPGDYKGFHARGGYSIGDAWHIDGSVWHRSLDYRSFMADVLSWQVGAQYRWLDGGTSSPSAALRLSAWGNRAPDMRKSTSTTIEGIKFSSATVTHPRDMQLQADAIGTWPLTQTLALNGFAGLGIGRVDFDHVSATSKQKGCEYQIDFGPDLVVATCNSGGQNITLSAPPSAYGIDVDKEARYDSRYLHLGGSVQWRSGPWRARAGYQYMRINRTNVDDILVRRGETAYKSNSVFIIDGGYQATAHVMLFARGQLMRNQFGGEIPMAYNTVSARRFNQRYGILSVGLNISF